MVNWWVSISWSGCCRSNLAVRRGCSCAHNTRRRYLDVALSVDRDYDGASTWTTWLCCAIRTDHQRRCYRRRCHRHRRYLLPLWSRWWWWWWWWRTLPSSEHVLIRCLLGRPTGWWRADREVVLGGEWHLYKTTTHPVSLPYNRPTPFGPFLYALTFPNINRFSKFFHCQNQEKSCDNTITKDPTTQ